jgi:hypothetical protein
MKRFLIASLAIVVLAVFASPAFAQAGSEKKDSANSNSAKPKPAMSKKELERKLIANEKSLWEAAKNKKADVFKKNLTADAFQIDQSGVAAKADIEKGINGCDMKDYSLSDFKLTSISGSAALLTYKANTHGTCGGQPIPETVYASSLWVTRGGRWQALFHQESAGTK